MQLANQDIAIRERAYAIWEKEGRPHGRDWDHWYRAAQEIAVRAPEARTAAPAKAEAGAAGKGRLRRALKSVLS